jgi:hypothetical protein
MLHSEEAYTRLYLIEKSIYSKMYVHIISAVYNIFRFSFLIIVGALYLYDPSLKDYAGKNKGLCAFLCSFTISVLPDKLVKIDIFIFLHFTLWFKFYTITFPSEYILLKPFV